MKVKIIKRAERENATQTVSVAVNNPKTGNSAEAATTVKRWIDELRQNREKERLLSQRLFKEEY